MALDIKDRLGRSPVYNEDGTSVAMRFMRDQRILVECGPHKERRQYVFSMRANISMTWVAEADAQCCLNVRGGCCGTSQPGVILFATGDEIRRWTSGGGR